MKLVDIQVPQSDREAVVVPPAGELVELVAANVRRLAGYGFTFAGRPFAAFRESARQEVLRVARDYTAAMGVKVVDAPHDLLVQTGHQPEFVHPGVWIKNHLCNRLSHAVGGLSLDLVVDNDAPPAGGVTMPVRRPDGFHRRHVAFAEVDAARAWEEHDDPVAWRIGEFAAETTALAYPGFETPILRRYLADAESWAPRAGDLGHLLTILRRRYEEHVGVSNLEVPASRLCGTHAFARFVLALAVEAGRFVTDYNAALAKYRRANDIHSPSHPIPDLPIEGKRCEMPFWIWRPKGERRRLHVDGADGLALMIEEETVFHVDAAMLRELSARDAETFDVEAARLLEESAGRFKVRPRAITTTIFSRLFLSDVFIHGVGGAKYDAITDEIVRRFFGVEPPTYITCSATLYLPIDVESARRDDLRRFRLEIRDIRCNPDRHLDGKQAECGPAERLVREKRDLVALSRELRQRAGRQGAHALREKRREVFLAIHERNAELASFLDDRLSALEEELERTRNRVEDQAVVRDRSYPFILYPQRQVMDFYDEVLQV